MPSNPSAPFLALTLGLLTACAAHERAPETATPSPWPTASESVLRVGGDLEARAAPERATKDGEEFVVWRHDLCAIDTPLPEGYPAPTPPDAIELKLYPLVRRAEALEPDSALAAFYPLLRHIQTRQIAMTSPVEMDYAPRADGTLETESMSFLYRRVDQGPVGAAEEKIVVRDRAEEVVLSIGVRGPLGPAAMERALETLHATIARHPGWRAKGSVRTFEYNGPYTKPADRWAEVQLPVEHGG